MMAKTPDPIDVEVGGKIKAQRRLVGMSENTLAARLGVTFQQIQKILEGTNRGQFKPFGDDCRDVWRAAGLFFPGTTVDLDQAAAAAASELVSLIETNEGRDLNVAFARIRSATMRRKVVGLVTALAAARSNIDCVSGK